MRVLVCGDRLWSDRKAILQRLAMLPASTVMIAGGASGADSIAAEIAIELGLETSVFRANWRRFGRAAGPIRNRQMPDQRPELVIAFHAAIRQSRGTRDCLLAAKKRGIPREIHPMQPLS